MRYTESAGNEDDILQGKDIYLRKMTEDDTDLIVKWRNQDFVRENFIYQKPFTRQGHRSWIENMIVCDLHGPGYAGGECVSERY